MDQEMPTSVGTKRKADEDLEDYMDELVGCTPRDLVIDNDKVGEAINIL